ncbi:hypothetical protein VTK56DRAFT_16 [Thermocarpiscus australiensis]
MQLSIAAALLACTAVQVQAFSDSSPFVLFSTAVLPDSATNNNTPQLQTSAQVLASAKRLLASCPTSRYVLVSQPNVHAADIRVHTHDDDDDSDGGGRSRCPMPSLCRAVSSSGSGSVFAVAEVVGQVSGRPLAEYVAAVCAEMGKEVRVDRVELKHLPSPSVREGKERRDVLEDNDLELGRLLETLGGDFTVVLFSDPNEFKAYEPEFVQPVHMDLKRRAEEAEDVPARKSNSADNLPLFEKYQFFTPGIFMALVVLAVILSILAVGLKAIASLEVSYGAFDKEMGPAAQKKQM